MQRVGLIRLFVVVLVLLAALSFLLSRRAVVEIDDGGEDIVAVLLDLQEAKTESTFIAHKNGVLTDFSVVDETVTLEPYPVFSIDFSQLRELNPDVVSWLRLPYLGLDTPIVQAVDNVFYGEHNFEKGENRGGWTFLDYRCVGVGLNTIIWGHNLKSGQMFGALKKYENYIDNSVEYGDLALYCTPTAYYVFRLYAINTVSAGSELFQVGFKDVDSFLSLMSRSWKSGGVFESTIADVERQILTLATCSSDDNRLVVQFKLVGKYVWANE